MIKMIENLVTKNFGNYDVTSGYDKIYTSYIYNLRDDNTDIDIVYVFNDTINICDNIVLYAYDKNKNRVIFECDKIEYNEFEKLNKLHILVSDMINCISNYLK